MAGAAKPVESPSEAEVLSAMSEIFRSPAVKDVFDQPVVKEMMELDMWGQQAGLDTDQRADLVRVLSTFLVSAKDATVAREYVRRAADIIAKVGNGLGSGDMKESLR